jgi:hypothetical protein
VFAKDSMQGFHRAQTGHSGDVARCLIGLFEQAPSELQAHPLHVGGRRGAGIGLENPREVSGAHRDSLGQRGYRQILSEVLGDPVSRLAQVAEHSESASGMP